MEKRNVNFQEGFRGKAILSVALYQQKVNEGGNTDVVGSCEGP